MGWQRDCSVGLPRTHWKTEIGHMRALFKRKQKVGVDDHGKPVYREVPTW
jgi:hypothetical protein